MTFDLEGPVTLAPLLETEIEDYMAAAATTKSEKQPSPSLHSDLMVCPESRRSQEELGNPGYILYLRESRVQLILCTVTFCID